MRARPGTTCSKYSLKEFPGTKLLATWVHDEGYVHTNGKQVKTLADFKGLKMRAPTRQTNKLLAALGASPVGMPLPAIPDAVSKGTIDGFLLPWEVMPSLKLQEMVKFHSETDPSRPALYSAVFVFAMNQAKYDSLPADLKKVIDNNAGAARRQQIGKIWDGSQAAGRKAAQDRGNAFYMIPASELDNWVKASAPLYDDWVADMDKRGNNGKAMLAEAPRAAREVQEVTDATPTRRRSAAVATLLRRLAHAFCADRHVRRRRLRGAALMTVTQRRTARADLAADPGRCRTDAVRDRAVDLAVPALVPAARRQHHRRLLHAAAAGGAQLRGSTASARCCWR